MNIMDKNIFTKDDLQKILTDKEAEWKYKFLRDFKTNYTLSPNNFKILLNQFIDTIINTTGKMPTLETFKTFVSPWIDEKYLKDNLNYKNIYDNISETLISAEETSKPKLQKSAAQSEAPVKEIPVKIKETIVRENSKFNNLETEVMTLLLKKSFNDMITKIVARINPALAEKIKNTKLFYDYRTFFQFLNKVMRPEWVDNDQFFERDWRQFSDISKKMYLTINKEAKISKIRTGADVRDFTRANFYGMILTADYCEDELKNPKIGFDYNSSIKFFTLSFEKNPDEVLDEAKFISTPYSINVFFELLKIILNKKNPTANFFFNEMSKISLLTDLLNSVQITEKDIFIKLKKAYYISLVYNYAITQIGTKTMTGYLNNKQELLTYSHPDVISKFNSITSNEDWKFNKEITDIGKNINIFNNNNSFSNEEILGNLIRAIIESIRAEITLLNSTSFVTSKNVKQGLERELSSGKYYVKVVEFLLENKDLIRDTIKKNQSR